MSAEDEYTYGILTRFVDGFFPSRWVMREEHDILDEDDESMFEACSINTNTLLECRTYEQAMNLLGFRLCDLFHSYFLSYLFMSF